MNSRLDTDTVASKSEEFFDETRTQDIFLLRGDGKKVTRIEYRDYRYYDGKNGAEKLGWLNKEGGHQFFKAENGGDPINLMGPALTKVTEENLKTIDLPAHLVDSGFKPETGYLLDLRLIQLNRLRSNASHGHIENLEWDEKLDISPDQFPFGLGGFNIPIEQLKIIPKNENLYIISWDNPLKVRSIVNIYPYKLSYLSSSFLDSLNFGEPRNAKDDDDKSELEHCEDVLTKYYGAAGVQIGTINPLDLGIPHMVGLACYVANLNSFIK